MNYFDSTDLSGALIEAGSETTTMYLNTLFIALLSNPEVLVKAHEELDRVIGPDRTPTFDDEQNLPYIRAMIKVSYGGMI
jgi:cytochrome P450